MSETVVHVTTLEQWKSIEEYKEAYEISNFGRVKNIKTGNVLKNRTDKDGYLDIALFKNGKRKRFKIHRLVAQAFIPNPENKPQVNHIDEDKTNNHVDNLEWCTIKYNVNYGTNRNRAAEKMSKKIKIIYPDGTFDFCNSISSFSKENHLSKGNIWMVLNGINKQYHGMKFEYVTERG